MIIIWIVLSVWIGIAILIAAIVGRIEKTLDFPLVVVSLLWPILLIVEAYLAFAPPNGYFYLYVFHCGIVKPGSL